MYLFTAAAIASATPSNALFTGSESERSAAPAPHMQAVRFREKLSAGNVIARLLQSHPTPHIVMCRTHSPIRSVAQFPHPPAAAHPLLRLAATPHNRTRTLITLIPSPKCYYYDGCCYYYYWYYPRPLRTQRMRTHCEVLTLQCCLTFFWSVVSLLHRPPPLTTTTHIHA
jgi:hypothetical protein